MITQALRKPFLLMFIASALMPLAASAQSTYFWRSEATSGNWQGGSGTVWWNSGVGSTGLSSTANVILLWDNNNILTQTNNTTGQFVHGMRLNSNSTEGFTFTGGHLQFFNFGTTAPFIRNDSTGTHTIDNNIRISGGSLLSITNNGTGGMIFNGNITNEGRNINVWGGRGSAGEDITFNGIISGTGGFYKENQLIRAVMTGANTYSGSTTLQGGTLMLTNNGSLASSLVRIGDLGFFDVRTDAQVRMISERGTGDAGTANIGTGATLTLVGNDLSVFQSVISGGGNLVKSGNSTLTLYGTQTYTGTTTINSGRLNTSGTMASKNFTVNGGEFRLDGNNRLSTDNDLAIALAGGTLRLQSGAQTINGTMSLGADTTSTISISGGSGNITMNGGISGAGNLIKAGTGSLFLNANNSYTGTTTLIDGGGIRTTGTMASGNYVLGSGTTLTTAGNNRLSSTANLTLNAATLRADSGGETIGGTVTLGSGTSTISVSVSATQGVVIDGLVVGTGNLTKTGGGRLSLAGDNSYTGTTTVSSGELVIDGDQSLATGNVTIAANATLSGSGTIGGATTISGIHSPGSSPGIQSFNSNLTYNAGSSINWELISNTTGGRGTNYDGIDLLGSANLNFAGATTLNLIFNSEGDVNWTASFWNANRDWVVFNLTDGITQNFQNLSVSTQDWADSLDNSFNLSRPGAGFTLTQVGQDVLLVYTVPEPSTYALLAMGALALAGYVIRRRRCRCS